MALCTMVNFYSRFDIIWALIDQTKLYFYYIVDNLKLIFR